MNEQKTSVARYYIEEEEFTHAIEELTGSVT
jgi:hypothetical protein